MPKPRNYNILDEDNIDLIIKHFFDEYKKYKHNKYSQHFISDLDKDANDNGSSTGYPKKSIDRILLDNIWESIRKTDSDNSSYTVETMKKLISLSIGKDLEAITRIVDKELDPAIRTVYMSHFIHSLERYARRKLCANFIVNLKAVAKYYDLDREYPSFKNSRQDREICVGKYKKEGRFEILYDPKAKPHHIRAGIGHELGHLMCIICDGNEDSTSHDEIFCSFLSIWFLAHRSDFYENTCRDFIMDFEKIVKNVYFFHTNRKNNSANHTTIRKKPKSTT